MTILIDKETGKEIPVFQPYLNEDEVKKFALEIMDAEINTPGDMLRFADGSGPKN